MTEKTKKWLLDVAEKQIETAHEVMEMAKEPTDANIRSYLYEVANDINKAAFDLLKLHLQTKDK